MNLETKRLDCPRCKGYVVIPILSSEEREYVGEKLRELRSSIEVIKHLSSWADFSITDGKRFAHHFGLQKGICSWCRKELLEHVSDVDHVICPHCQSLNLDW